MLTTNPRLILSPTIIGRKGVALQLFVRTELSVQGNPTFFSSAVLSFFFFFVSLRFAFVPPFLPGPDSSSGILFREDGL